MGGAGNCVNFIEGKDWRKESEAEIYAKET